MDCLIQGKTSGLANGLYREAWDHGKVESRLGFAYYDAYLGLRIRMVISRILQNTFYRHGIYKRPLKSKQVRIHEISRDSYNLCPPRHL